MGWEGTSQCPPAPSRVASPCEAADGGTDMGSMPTSSDQITPAWLAQATGLAIEAAELEQIGIGIGVSSAVYRARLTGPSCPETVVIKLPALDEAAVFTSTVLRMYTREAGF